MFLKFVLFTLAGFVSFYSVDHACAQAAGNWQGTWLSESNGHSGKLNARIHQVSPSQYRAVFRGTYFKVLPFRYATTLDVVGCGPGYVQLAGGKKLGPVMGEFRYQACVSGNQFQATFRSKRDHGVWQMRKVN